jgi:hypothetical protein
LRTLSQFAELDDQEFQNKLIKTILSMRDSDSNVYRTQALTDLMSKMKLTPALRRSLKAFAEANLEKQDKVTFLVMLDATE